MSLISLIFLAVFGTEVLSGILLINVMTFFAIVLKGLLAGTFVPFSIEIGTTGNRNFGEAFIFFGIIGAIAGIHFMINKWVPSFTWIMILIAICMCKLASNMILLKNKCEIN